MAKRFKRTVLTALCLFGTYWLYAFLTAPILTIDGIAEPVQEHQSPEGIEKPPVRNVLMAKRHLSHQNWSVDAKYQFSTTEQAYLFTNEWERVEPSGAVRFEPFAMIWFEHPDRPNEVPITLYAESAQIEFDKPFSMTNPEPGRVIGGALEGKVDIQGPDGLSILGKNFVYSEAAMRIWSDNSVEFAFQNHRGRAHGVQLELVQRPDDNLGNALAAEGVRSVRLRRNVELQLHVAEEQEEPTVVDVTSDGAFEFLIEENVATFENNVSVKRPTGTDQFDRLKCDLMTLILAAGDKETSAGDAKPEEVSLPEKEEQLADNSAPDGESSSFGSVGSNLRFQRLRAQGKRVILVSEENDLVANMTEFVYDVDSKIAVLLDGQGVRVRHKMSDMQAPEITLLHTDDGQISSAWCRGAGQLQHRDEETGELSLVARWLKQLKKYDDPDTNAEVIELQGQAVVRQPQEESGLAAELIKLWFEDDGSSANGSSNDLQSRSGSLKPKRLLAIEQVAIVTPSLEGETERLEVWFEEQYETTPRTEAAHLQDQSRDRLISTSARYTRPAPQGFASTNDDVASREITPKSAAPDEKNTHPSPFDEEDSPVVVSAKLIRVRAHRGGPDNNQMQVAEVWTEGRVQVTQQRDPAQVPLRLTGQRLHLVNHAENQQEVRIYGSPAAIRDQSAYIEGDEIFFDRANNRSIIQGKGLLRIPVKSDLNGKELEEVTDLDIWWSEKMTFDGLQAQFYGDVRAVLEDNRMNCQQMHVELTERISFNGEESGSKSAEIRHLQCNDGVQFDSYEYENNKLTSVRKAHFWEFSMNQLTGDTEATGPGYILFWRKGKGNRAGLGPVGVVRANRPLKSESSDWEYVRIDFTGQTVGNLQQKHSTFRDRVQIVYGPVQRPLDVIDPDELPDDAGWMRCNELQFSQLTGETPTTQLLASGNAELEGRTFHARADTISFDEAKGLYMLRSLGNRKATIWRQKRVGDEYSRADAQRMEFIPARNQLKLDRTSGVQGLQ